MVVPVGPRLHPDHGVPFGGFVVAEGRVRVVGHGGTAVGGLFTKLGKAVVCPLPRRGDPVGLLGDTKAAHGPD